MDAKVIQEKIDNYRRSREEWLRRRDECVAKAQMCSGAIEALEDLLPTPTLEEVVASVDG